MRPSNRPTLAIWKFASCDGCQLTLLDCEQELLAVAAAVDIARFPEATRALRPGPYDISLVEGSITTAADRARIQAVRRQSGLLVAIGACASSGGIQALRNLADLADLTAAVYARPDYLDTLAESTPIAEHVPVDYELRGCPIAKGQLLEVITALLAGRRPSLPPHSVCLDCKLAGQVCVMVAQGIPCLGPLTQAGCGALCPGFQRGCYGCFGPMEQPNRPALERRLRALGVDAPGAGRLDGGFDARLRTLTSDTGTSHTGH